MKVNIGPYKSWIGPYQIAEKILFWKDKHTDEAVYDLGEKLASIEWLNTLCKWVDSKKKRKVKVHIDHYDVWSLDHTLAMIILPALKQMKKDNTGHPCGVSSDQDPVCGKCDCEKEWHNILDKMIWSFEQIAEDDINAHTPEEYKLQQERIQEGLMLFAKYFQTLWT
jgi:hypothetical protein